MSLLEADVLTDPEKRREAREALALLQKTKGWQLLMELADEKKKALFGNIIATVPDGVGSVLKEQYAKGEVAGLLWVVNQPTYWLTAISEAIANDSARSDSN